MLWVRILEHPVETVPGSCRSFTASHHPSVASAAKANQLSVNITKSLCSGKILCVQVERTFAVCLCNLPSVGTKQQKQGNSCTQTNPLTPLPLKSRASRGLNHAPWLPPGHLESVHGGLSLQQWNKSRVQGSDPWRSWSVVNLSVRVIILCFYGLGMMKCDT
jgi:hypothetical protein